MDWASFLKSSTVVDFAVIFFVLLASVAFVIGAIVVVVTAKSRKPIYVLLCLSFLPLVMTLLGAEYRYRRVDQLFALYPQIDAAAKEQYQQVLRDEYLIMCLIGMPGTVVPLLIGIGALFVRKGKSE